MAAIGPIDADTAAQLLTFLRTIDEPLTEQAARDLAADNGWTIDADAPGEGFVATGTWPGGNEAIMFGFTDGQTPNFTISAFAGLATDPVAAQTAIDTFAMLVHQAHELFGPRTGEILGASPRAWWTLPGQTISLSRGGSSATIMWATHADHDDLINSAREDS